MKSPKSTDKKSAPVLPAFVEEVWPIEKLEAYAGNARKHNQKQIDQLRGSMREFGQVFPLLVRESGVLVSGHGRLEAMQQEGFTEVRVVVARNWTEVQCRAFAIFDNKVAENSTWDQDKLRLELIELGQIGIDVEQLGFSPGEIAGLDDPDEGLTDPDEAPEAPVVPVTVRGDVWLLGSHRLVCGDSTRAEDVARAMNGAAPHLMVTDPPYGVEYDASWRNDALKKSKRAAGKVLNDDCADWREAWGLFAGDVAYVWQGDKQITDMATQLIAAGFEQRNLIVWAKSHFAISRGNYHPMHETCWYSVRKGKTGHWHGDKKQTTLWEIPKPAKSETGHSTQKPVECMRRPIENNSRKGDHVYEPFSGSGTTIIAAEMTGRKCCAVELNAAYVDVAVARWEAFTGKTATLDACGRSFSEIARLRAEAKHESAA